MEDLENIFKALADKNRLRILKLLEKKKLCVCELAEILGITRLLGLLGTRDFWGRVTHPFNMYSPQCGLLRTSGDV